MRLTIILCLIFLISGSAVALTAAKPAPVDEAVNAFWQKFKTAVTSGDKGAVVALTKFPVEMSYGIPKIKNGAELRRRWRALFTEQTNAAQCFARKGPEIDATNPKRFTVACPNEAGDEVVIYAFLRTRTGWKFVSLDNINE